jgi:hypothetical protein
MVKPQNAAMVTRAAAIEAMAARRSTDIPMKRSVLPFIGEYRIADHTRSHFYAAGFTSR